MKPPIRLGLQIPNFDFPGVPPDELFERGHRPADELDARGEHRRSPPSFQ